MRRPAWAFRRLEQHASAARRRRAAKLGSLILLACAAVSAPALAQVVVANPWVRATVAQQRSSGAFMRITASRDSRLVEVRTSVAAVAEIHEMAMHGDVMTMHAVPALELRAGKAVDLEPGGYHVMLMGLKQQLKAGDTVRLTLVVEGQDHRRELVEVSAAVKPLAGAADEMHKMR